MNEILIRVLALVCGYCFGLFQTAYLYGKMNHIDIRDYGSGNSGTTNALRVLGKKAGVITYAGDMLKACFAGTTMRLLCMYVFGIEEQSFIFMIIIYAGLGAALGHNYPFYMGFKGGKGIAVASGVILAIFDWKFIVLGLLIFGITLLITRYVSLGSILLMIGFFLEILIFGLLEYNLTSEQMIKWFAIPVKGHFPEILIVTFIYCAMAVIRHRANIVRLINGNENKFGKKKD
ncbi:MAG: glycerol-3-phosphate 1-O-acyltransferase PlsY [Lachnospiraceae bacterium]|nr:glycerol-3-phosphate 1-O-acyltransferase PlsY [Lachnospiraceae bacterium]